MGPHFCVFAALAQLIFIQCQVMQPSNDESPDSKISPFQIPPLWGEEDHSNENEPKDEDHSDERGSIAPEYTPTSTEAPSICNEDVISDYHEAQKDMFNLFFGNFQPCSAAKVLSDITCSENSEEKVQQIKDAIDRITSATKMELYNVLESAMSVVNNAGSRKKRSLETPMDSAKLVMRLLKHIKANNEHQNIAIEKMMTGQEIADKYGIEFNPEPEIILDLAAATTEQAEQLRKLVDNEDVDYVDYVDYVPYVGENEIKNNSYYQYQMQQPEEITVSQHEQNNTVNVDAPQVDVSKVDVSQIDAPKVDVPQVNVSKVNVAHVDVPHVGVPHYHYWQPDYESQIVAPAVSERPNIFYDTPAFTPAPDFHTTFAPVLEETTVYIVPESKEPELVGEEYEETMTSKVLVEQGNEPGSATMNHVTTYTVSERAHFKAPEVASLPQQVQYYFYLM